VGETLNMYKPRSLLTKHAKSLRNNPTEAEKGLWQRLKSSQLEGVKFRRQEPIEGFIVDFVSLDKKIVIELDGGQHAENLDDDQRRDRCLMANGFTVLRFWNHEVFQNPEGVLEVIRKHCIGEAGGGRGVGEPPSCHRNT
jgi:very-short-patch-repair endonuclease